MFPVYYVLVSTALGALGGLLLGYVIGTLVYELSSAAGYGFGPPIKRIAAITAAISGGIIAACTTEIIRVFCT